MAVETTVHQVSVKVSEGGYNLYSVGDFLKISPADRMEMMLQKKIQYLDDMGQVVPLYEGTKQLGAIQRNQGWSG